jgi:hypothetical protein
MQNPDEVKYVGLAINAEVGIVVADGVTTEVST